MQFLAERQALIDTSHSIYQRHWAYATAGNFSVRVEDQHWLMTLPGKHKGRLSLEDIGLMSPEGESLDGHSALSSELPLHLALYQLKPEIGAILHTHSQYSTVLSRHLAAMDVLPLRGYEMLKALHGLHSHDDCLMIPIFDNHDSQTLAEQLATRLQDPRLPSFIIRGHGLYTWGLDLDDCLRQLEAMEYLLEAEYHGHCLRR